MLGFAAPAHADNISISLDTANATLRGSGKYLHYKNVVTVDNSNSYGFTLSMYANNPNLVNSSDSNYVINSVSGHNRYLGANQWGYSMTGDSGTFNEIPNSSYNAATLADVTNDAKGVCDRVSYCGIPITFGANIEPKKSASGHYSTTLTYTATSKPAPYVPPAPDPDPYVPPLPPAPEPYVPPTPKWTTNGCYYSGGDWHNCISFNEPNATRKVVWKGDAWYAIKADMWESWFNYNNYNATWAHAAILTESGEQKYTSMHGYGSTVQSAKLDSNDIVKILAYVPAYSRQGNYINFCGSIDTTTHKCEYSDVGSSFSEHVKSTSYLGDGFWVGLHAMGCTNVPDESKCNDYHYMTICEISNDALVSYYYPYNTVANAKKVADTLAEALGSPCY